MRFNDKELSKLSECTRPELEGILHHVKPQGNQLYNPSWSKERYFKLISNLLFYWRVNEDSQEPLGVIVLEYAEIAYERPHRGIPFAFSITFKLQDRLKDNEAKHVFSCRCEADVNKWVSTLRMHSYEYWRNQYIILKTKISMKTGHDPVLNYMRSKHPKEPCSGNVLKTAKEKKSSTFYTQIESDFQETRTRTKVTSNTVDNLIDL